MIPGSTHQPPLEFPETWLGLWKDATGRVVCFQRVSARQVQVNVFQGLRLPSFPMLEGGLSLDLPGLYTYEPGVGPLLQVMVGPVDAGPDLFFKFSAAQGDRLRFAEPWDLVSLITMYPLTPKDQTYVQWMAPLGPYAKANEDWETFIQAHPEYK